MLNQSSTQWPALSIPYVTMAIYRLATSHYVVKIRVNTVSVLLTEMEANKNIFYCFSVYIPINPKLPSERQLKITIVSNGMMNARQDWNIAVHQFECPFGQSRVSANPAQENFIPATFESENVGIIRQPRTFISDWLAPPGCLQFHANPNGMVETFNFNNGAG